MEKKSKINKKIIAYSIIGFIFIGLVFFVDWKFIIGAVLMMILNQKELMRQ